MVVETVTRWFNMSRDGWTKSRGGWEGLLHQVMIPFSASHVASLGVFNLALMYYVLQATADLLRRWQMYVRHVTEASIVSCES